MHSTDLCRQIFAVDAGHWPGKLTCCKFRCLDGRCDSTAVDSMQPMQTNASNPHKVPMTHRCCMAAIVSLCADLPMLQPTDSVGRSQQKFCSTTLAADVPTLRFSLQPAGSYDASNPRPAPSCKVLAVAFAARGPHLFGRSSLT